MNWYVIQTTPQGERKAAGELRRAGLRVYLPMRSHEVRDRQNHSKPTLRFRPLLIGYLFVRFPHQMLDRGGRPQFGAIRNCQGVKGYLRGTNDLGDWEPFSVPEKAVSDFMRRQRRREFGRPAVLDGKKRLAEMRKTFRRGSHVRVTDGPFASFIGVLERLNKNETAVVELSIFGRENPITLQVGQFEIVRVARAREAA